MSTDLGDLLDTARRQRLVGRRRELASFGDALNGRSPRRLLFVHGQGGIGKTTLLLEFRARARVAGRSVALIDGREVDPSREDFEAAIWAALGSQSDRHPVAQPLTGTVLLVDGYEHLTPIDGWLRNEFVPSLGTGTVVVLAGRDPPTAPWRTDSGWRQLVAVHRLDRFDPVESGELLGHADVAPAVRPHLMMLGRGHPLTLALLADLAATGAVPGTLADAPDLISTLLESFLRDVPSEAHLTGLAACAIAWLTTEDLLAELVGADAPAVWQWLVQRPFLSVGSHGLAAHDLARDVLDAEFQRRSPERYRAYGRIIYAHAVAGLRAATGPDRWRHARPLLFMLRNNPMAGPISELRARGSEVVLGRPEEHDAVCAIIERFEGPANAKLARDWLGEQPDLLSVVRTSSGVGGFVYPVMCPSGSMLEDRDPVVRAVLDHIAREAPLRPGECVAICRFCAGAHDHQRDRYAMVAAFLTHLIALVARAPAWSVLVAVDPQAVASWANYGAFAPLVGIDVEVGGLRHVAYGIDWRCVPVDAWLDLMRERAHSGDTGPPPAALLRPPPLDRARFAAAVKTALQTLHRPDQLATNPLLGSALAATATGPTAKQLRATIDNAVTYLGDQPKGDQLRKVLHRTYLRPAPTQEAAAQVLDLPLSTYRRYLAKALDQLTHLLWTVEIGDLQLPAGPSE